MPVLVVATTNRGKLKEIRALLAGVPVELRTLADFPAVAAPEETGRSFAENARLKALYYAGHTHELTVAEDSGLEIDALDGAPGVESARFGGEQSSYPEKFALLYDALRARKASAFAPRASADTLTARFVCALALARNGEVLFETRGTVEGEIAAEPRGSAGFGYDPIFFYPPFGSTLAEATQEQKSSVSHRGKAFRALGAYLTMLNAENAENAE